MGVGQRGDNNYIDIGVRAGYHDSLDRPSGFPQFFDLEGAAATLRLYDQDDNASSRNAQPNSVVLQNLTLIRGRSFNPINSAKKGKTWGAAIEATRVNDGSQENGTDHLVASVGYESGWSWAFGTPKANTGEMPPQLCYTFCQERRRQGEVSIKAFALAQVSMLDVAIRLTISYVRRLNCNCHIGIMAAVMKPTFVVITGNRYRR